MAFMVKESFTAEPDCIHCLLVLLSESMKWKHFERIIDYKKPFGWLYCIFVKVVVGFHV